MRYLAIALSALIGAGPAAADDAADWEGFYAGIQFGTSDFSVGGGAAPPAPGSDTGFIGGVHAGYNRDFGRFILGGEVDFDAADTSFTGGDLDSVTRLKLRAGPDLGRSFLYGSLGAAYIDGSTFSGWGFSIGGGIDYLLNDRWVIGGDVLYQEADDVTGSGVDFDGTSVRVRTSLRF